MNINEIRLELLEIAAALDRTAATTEECLCSDEAQRIRELVDELKGMGSVSMFTRNGGNFREDS